MSDSVTEAGIPRARTLISTVFKELDCKESRKAAAATEGYLEAAPEDVEFFVRQVSFEKPCFASLVAAKAAGQFPEKKAAIAAAAKAGVADYLSSHRSGGKIPTLSEEYLAQHPELAGASSDSIDLAIAAGATNGSADGWLWDVLLSRPYFAMDGSFNPGATAGSSKASSDSKDEAPTRPRRPRPPRGRDVSPSFPAPSGGG